MSNRFLFFIVFIALVLCQSFLSAAELKGSLSGDLYSWTAGEEDHIRPYLSLRANLLVWKSGPDRALSFHTYSRWMTDWQDKTAADPQFFAYDAYLKFRGFPARTTIYAGRQFVYSTAGSALIDGVRVKYGPFSNMEIELIGGSRVSRLDPEEIASLTDFAVFGGQLNYQFHPRTRFGLGWMRRTYDGFVSYHRLSVDASQTMEKSRLYARFSINPDIVRRSEVLLRAQHSLKVWYFSGEFLWRDPSVSYNSIFSLIDFKRYRELRLEARRDVGRGTALFVNLRSDFFSIENAWATRLGIRAGYFTLAWVHQSGYAGDTDGLSGDVNLRFRKNWLIFGRANVSQYRVQEEQDDRSEAYATGIGIMRRFGRDMQVRVEWQYLRNAVQSYDSRFHFRISKGFDLK